MSKGELHFFFAAAAAAAAAAGSGVRPHPATTTMLTIKFATIFGTHVSSSFYCF